MSAKWEPGTLAMISGSEGSAVLAFRQERQWATIEHLYFADWQVSEARPLVVIDPEDREQVERLAKGLPLMWNLFQPDDPELGAESVDAMQAALREFADPKPPKPEEPTGLGAVVEDAEGCKWVRTFDAEAPWMDLASSGDNWRYYKAIDAVRVLSERVHDA